MADRANTSAIVSIVSLCIAISTAIFSVYQWSNSQQENLINTAIEISKVYFRESDHATSLLIWQVARQNATPDSPDQIYKILRQVNFLRYVAFLTVAKRLDPRYVSTSLECEIVWAHIAAKSLFKEPDGGSLEVFSRDHKCEGQPATVPLPSH
jgi:hypothetical protein